MKKLLSICVCIVLCVGVLVSCGAKLPEGMQEETVITEAERFIALLNAAKYTDAAATMDATMQAALEKDGQKADAALEAIWAPVAEKIGAYEKIDKSAVSAKDGFAVIALLAKYQNSNVVFTLSYDTDMKLAGFYYK